MAKEFTGAQIERALERVKIELDGKAPAIIDTLTSYQHTKVKNVTFIGNPWAWRNARYANRKNLIEITDKTLTNAGVTSEFHGNLEVRNGTGTSENDVVIVEKSADIPAGNYVFKIEVYAGNSSLTGGKNMRIDLWYDSDLDLTIPSKQVVIEGLQGATKSQSFTTTAHVGKIRVWNSVRADIYNDYRLYYSLFPADTVITDTEEYIAVNETLDYAIPESVKEVDTMMHESRATTVMDTKQYIDDHVLSGYMTFHIDEDGYLVCTRRKNADLNFRVDEDGYLVIESEAST